MSRRVPPRQRTLPRSATEAIQKATEAMVVFGRQLGGTAMDATDSDDKVRAYIKATFVEAIEDDAEYQIEYQKLKGMTETDLSMAWLFRTVFNLFQIDRKDAWVQERLWAIVELTMTRTLARNDGDFAKRPTA